MMSTPRSGSGQQPLSADGSPSGISPFQQQQPSGQRRMGYPCAPLLLSAPEHMQQLGAPNPGESVDSFGDGQQQLMSPECDNGDDDGEGSGPISDLMLPFAIDGAEEALPALMQSSMAGWEASSGAARGGWGARGLSAGPGAEFAELIPSTLSSLGAPGVCVFVHLLFCSALLYCSVLLYCSTLLYRHEFAIHDGPGVGARV